VLQWIILMVASITIPHKYTPRDYQLPFLAAMDGGMKRAVLVWHRRAGKDKTCLNYMIKEMCKRVGSYYYYFPTMSLGRKIIWDGVDKDGFKFLDHFPREIISGQANQQEMKIKLRNGSIFQVVGTDRLDIVGPNPVGCVFSEFALQNPKGWDYTRPILAENDGWAVFPYTPRGKNHGYRLFRLAQGNPKEWYVSQLSVDDTHAIPQSAIETERRSGMSDRLIQQEFYVSFEGGVEGSFYNDILNVLYSQGRISNLLAYNASLPVYTVCDPGYHWPWVFFQIRGNEPIVIRAYEELGLGIEKHIDILRQYEQDYGYRYAQHFAPVDTEKNNAYKAVAGKTLVEHAREYHLNFTILEPEYRVIDGIMRTRKFLYGCWFVQDDCQLLIDALETYAARKDERHSTETEPVFFDREAESWANHLADCIRYLSLAVPKIEVDIHGVDNQELEELLQTHVMRW
jgi:phage terminase large subunit